MRKIHCIIYEDAGQFVAQCVNTGVATQGDTYEEGLRNIREAVELYFEDDDAPYVPIGAITLAEQYVNA